MAQHHRHLLTAKFRQETLVAEDAPRHVAVRENIRLQRQIRTSTVHQMHHRQMVLEGDVVDAQVLLHPQGVPRPAFDRAVVGHDGHLSAVDHADTADNAGAGHLAVVGLVGGQRGELQKRSARVEQQIQPVADE